MAAVKPPEVRAARSFLRSYAKAGTKDVSPRKFAQAAKELSVGFRELLRFIAQLQAGGAEHGVFRMDLLRRLANRG
jgi:hypothetical protein